MTKPLELLLGLLDERVFRPTGAATAASYATAEEAKLLRRVQKRVHETRVRYFGDYSTAAQVKANFVQDLHSKPGQELANDMYLLRLTRFEDVREEFLERCRELGV